jgi:hypothetical protein
MMRKEFGDRNKECINVGCWWLMPSMPVTWDTEIRRAEV